MDVQFGLKVFNLMTDFKKKSTTFWVNALDNTIFQTDESKSLF
jgi:hypothetical protein